MPLLDKFNLSIESIPLKENESFEFKSSKTKTDDLLNKILKAVSGFANTGGGYFVAGIDDKTGFVDGGISKKVGTTPLEDWVDNAVHKIEPVPTYSVALLDFIGNRGELHENHVVLVIAVEESNIGPHMADGKYYIRTGAHTGPARHFIVEAIRSKRYESKPVLTHLFRLKPIDEHILQLGILCLTNSPALNVTINLNPIPKVLENIKADLPVTISLVDVNNPFYFDVSPFDNSKSQFGNNILLTVKYFDFHLNEYTYVETIGVDNSTVPIRIGNNYPQKTVNVLEAIVKAINKIDTKRAIKNKPILYKSNISEHVASYIEKILPELLLDMSRDVKSNSFIREFILYHEEWLYNEDSDNKVFFYYFEQHEYLRGKIRILENCGLVYEVKYDNIDRFILTEQFVVYLMK